MVHFPVSGVDVNPLLPLLVAFAVSALTAPAGVSGAFLLLPFQVSVLGFTSPAVSPTNLVYNILATPGGVYRYVREGRVVWPLAWAVILGTLPGVFVGAVLRVTVLSDPRAFEVFVGLVLLYFGVRLLYGVARPGRGPVGAPTGGAGTVQSTDASLHRVEYEYGGKTYAFGPRGVFALSLGVGVIGGIYSIGGGSIIAPFLVTVFGLPVYTVAGATLLGTFVTSVAGVAYQSRSGEVSTVSSHIALIRSSPSILCAWPTQAVAECQSERSFRQHTEKATASPPLSASVLPTTSILPLADPVAERAVAWVPLSPPSLTRSITRVEPSSVCHVPSRFMDPFPPTRRSRRPWSRRRACPPAPRPRGRWPPPGTPARRRRSRCTPRGE
jgi:uncharacterized protein